MIDHTANLLALRALVTSLPPVAWSAGELGSNADGYTRAAGSFIEDGFVAGLEVVPTGYASNAPGIIVAVTALQLTIDGGRGVEGAQGGRTLVAGLPPLRAWEGVSFPPKGVQLDGRCYLEEDYLPGPAFEVTSGPRGQIEGDPMYVLKLYFPQGKGIGGPYKLADAFLRLFPPRLVILATGDKMLRVRKQPAPYRGQLTTTRAGRAVIVVTIPLRARAVNII